MTLPFNRLTAYNICRDCFSVLWLFQSHAAVVKHYNAFCVKCANSDTEQNIINLSTFPVCDCVNIFTFNELWYVAFCHTTRRVWRVCNVRRQNSCDKFYKVV